ncbi:MAG: thiolase domain-containing protein [Candidatus Thorarchaeota archaeon]|nr:MAG: thiolase domain-containing protein [Candidatus Thorarchaeota archaeon]
MEPVYVVGVGMTPFGVLEDSILELAERASHEAIMDADAAEQTFDRFVVGSQNPDEFTGLGHLSTQLADLIGIVPAGATRVETGPSSGSSAFESAFSFVSAGLSDLALVVGVEKMSSVERSEASRILSKMMSYENETKYGATPVALAAMVARRYMHEYGLTRDELSLVPVKAHRNGARNPLAHFQKEVTVEKVNTSRVVAHPLTLYDSCPTSDGAAAIVLASERIVKNLGIRDRSVQVLGVGHATDFHAVQHRLSLTSMNATVVAAERAYAMANLGPSDIDLFELHDAFSILELINMEDVGMTNPGMAIDMIKDGATEVDGMTPVNPTGGLKARGHPTGATGVAQIRDAVVQIREEAPRGLQTASPEVVLTHNIGGFGNNMVVSILGSSSR